MATLGYIFLVLIAGAVVGAVVFGVAYYRALQNLM